jgi:hypothetical protein
LVSDAFRFIEKNFTAITQEQLSSAFQNSKPVRAVMSSPDRLSFTEWMEFLSWCSYYEF